MKPHSTLPEPLKVQNFLDYRDYLKEVFKSRTQSEPGFNYARWASEIGFKSRDHVRLIIFGKRNLTREMVEVMNTSLRHDKKDAEYFRVLVEQNQAKSPQMQDMLMQKLMKSHSQGRLPVRDIYGFLSSYLSTRIFVYLDLKDMDRSLVGTARALGAPVAKVHEILENLESLGYIKQDSNTQEYTLIQNSLSIPDEIGNVALQSYHRKSLEEAIGKLALSPQQRHFRATSLVLSECDYRQLCEMIKDFVSHAGDAFDTQSGAEKKIYQLNVNLAPVSEQLILKTVLPQGKPSAPELAQDL